MKFLNELEKVLKSDERFLGENNQIIKTKVSDSARGEDVIIMTIANSNDEIKFLDLYNKYNNDKRG